MTTLTLLAALALDALLGEPRRWHPLVGFGNYSLAIENRLYQSSRWYGVLALTFAVLPFVLLTFFAQQFIPSALLTVVLLYLAIGHKSLALHANPIATALAAGDIDQARHRLSYIVSRDTDAIDPEGISKATIESVLENGCDAIFGAIFWAVIAGAPGVVLYRLVNTLDAMWGYKNVRYLQFGWAAARLDDVLNFIPARLTAFSYALVGNFKNALHCWHAQGNDWKSPNAGPVMAAGAGSMNVLLGGSAQYHGKPQARPTLGMGNSAKAIDISRALQLVRRALVVWVFVFAVVKIPLTL